MSDLNVNFADVKLSPTHTPDRMKSRMVFAGKAGDRFRVMAVDAKRYLLFFGECDFDGVEPPTGVPIANELTREDEGKVKEIDGKKYTVVGTGGSAICASKRAKPEILARPEPGMHEMKGRSPAGPVIIRKIGTRYQAFCVRGDKLLFFAEEEVGPGFPVATLKNGLTLRDAQSRKIIDGVEYTVASTGGEITIKPNFERKRPRKGDDDGR